MTIYDLTAIRFGLSSLIVFPFILYFKTWRTISFVKSLAVAFSIGPIYALLAFGGFMFSPAFHGGVFMNGFLPFIVVLLGFIFGQRIKVLQLGGIMFILLGSIIILVEAQGFSQKNSWFGDVLFILAAFFLAFFMNLVKKWDLQYIQILYCICLVNAVFYLPLWFFFLPSGIESFNIFWHDQNVIINVLFQGFIPNLLGLFLTAYSAKIIGPPKASAVLAAVPTMGALLGFLLLSETPTFFGWVSLVVVSTGILMVVIKGDDIGKC